MRVCNRRAMVLTLLLTLIVNSALCADKPATKAAPSKRAKAKAKAEMKAMLPADALKPDVVDAKAVKAQDEAERARKAAELVNLDAVAAPLRALFGGAV